STTSTAEVAGTPGWRTANANAGDTPTFDRMLMMGIPPVKALGRRSSSFVNEQQTTALRTTAQLPTMRGDERESERTGHGRNAPAVEPRRPRRRLRGPRHE